MPSMRIMRGERPPEDGERMFMSVEMAISRACTCALHLHTSVEMAIA